MSTKQPNNFSSVTCFILLFPRNTFNLYLLASRYWSLLLVLITIIFVLSELGTMRLILHHRVRSLARFLYVFYICRSRVFGGIICKE